MEWHCVLTKQLDIDFLKRMNAAELVKLMVDLVEDEGLVVVRSIVLHYIIHCGQEREGGLSMRKAKTSNFSKRSQRLYFSVGPR